MLMVELPAKEYEKLLEESVNLKETVLRHKKRITIRTFRSFLAVQGHSAYWRKY